jgi:organic radical activating enzyme
MTSPGASESGGQVAEVFRSYQGEGLLLGRRQVFVRLAGCTVGCRYCDTEWAFQAPADVAVPGSPGARVTNPLSATQVAELVDAADPPGSAAGPAAVSLTGGEPLEQATFCSELLDALSTREVMLETAALDAGALARLVPKLRWVAADLKLPSATGQPDVLERHERVLSTGVLDNVETFFKLIVDGDTTDDEVSAAADLLARHAAGRPVFLQPVTPLGGSPALPGARLDALVDVLASRVLPVRVVPQVHKVLRVR